MADTFEIVIDELRNVADAIDEAWGSKMTGVVRIVGPVSSQSIRASNAELFRRLADKLEDFTFPFEA